MYPSQLIWVSAYNQLLTIRSLGRAAVPCPASREPAVPEAGEFTKLSLAGDHSVVVDTRHFGGLTNVPFGTPLRYTERKQL